MWMVSASGASFREHVQTGSEPGSYTRTPSWNDRLFSGFTGAQVSTGLAGSPGNHLLWATVDDAGVETVRLYDWNNGTQQIVPLPHQSYAINDQKMVVGSLMRCDEATNQQIGYEGGENGRGELASRR